MGRTDKLKAMMGIPAQYVDSPKGGPVETPAASPVKRRAKLEALIAGSTPEVANGIALETPEPDYSFWGAKPNGIADLFADRPQQPMPAGEGEAVVNPAGPDQRVRQPGERSQFVKSLETGGENVISSLLGTAATVLRAGQNMPGKWYPDTPELRTKNEQNAKKLDQWAQMIYEDAQRPEMQPKPGSGPWQYIQHVTGNTLPFMATAMGAGWATGPAGAFLVGAAAEGDNAYRDAIGNGASEEDAQLERVVVGTLNGAIEQMQIGGLLKLGKTSAPVVKRIVRAARAKAWSKLAKAGGKLTGQHVLNSVNEGLEEALQETVGIGAATIHGDKIELKEDAERILGAGLGGLTSGAILGGASTLTESMKEPEPGRKTPYENEQPKPKTMDEFAAKMRKEQGLDELPVIEPGRSESEESQKKVIDELPIASPEDVKSAEAQAAPAKAKLRTEEQLQAANEEVTGDTRIKEIDGTIRRIRSIPVMLGRDLTSEEKASIRALEQERDQIVSGKASVAQTTPTALDVSDAEVAAERESRLSRIRAARQRAANPETRKQTTNDLLLGITPQTPPVDQAAVEQLDRNIANLESGAMDSTLREYLRDIKVDDVAYRVLAGEPVSQDLADAVKDRVQEKLDEFIESDRVRTENQKAPDGGAATDRQMAREVVFTLGGIAKWNEFLNAFESASTLKEAMRTPGVENLSVTETDMLARHWMLHHARGSGSNIRFTENLATSTTPTPAAAAVPDAAGVAAEVKQLPSEQPAQPEPPSAKPAQSAKSAVGAGPEFFEKEERKALQGLGYTIREIAGMNVAEGRRRIANGIAKEAAETPTGPTASGPAVPAATQEAPAATVVPEPAKPAEEVTPKSPATTPSTVKEDLTVQKQPWEMTWGEIKTEQQARRAALPTQVAAAEVKYADARKQYDDTRKKQSNRIKAILKRIARLNPTGDLDNVSTADKRIIAELEAERDQIVLAMRDAQAPIRSDFVSAETAATYIPSGQYEHINAVKRAVQQGQPVPRAVLEEYKSEPWAAEALSKLEKGSPRVEEVQTQTEKVETKNIGPQRQTSVEGEGAAATTAAPALPEKEVSVPKILQENYEEWQRRATGKPWQEYLDGVLSGFREDVEGSGYGDITADVLRKAKALKAKQRTQSLEGSTSILYDVWAEMPDGSKVYAREIGPYKHYIWRPDWRGGTSLTQEQLSEQAKDARKGARLDKDLNVWALEELRNEYQSSPSETPTAVSDKEKPAEPSDVEAFRAGIRSYVRGQGKRPAIPGRLKAKEVDQIIAAEQDAVEEQDGELKQVMRSRRMKNLPKQAEQPKSDMSESEPLTSPLTKARDETGKVKEPEKPSSSQWGANNTRVTRSEYEAILAKRAAKKGRLPGGNQAGATTMLDPEDWMDMLKIGMFHIEAGARKFAEWAELMVTDLEDDVKPHLNDIWQASGGALYEKAEQAKAQEPIDTTTQEVVESSTTEQSNEPGTEQPGTRRDRTSETPTSPEPSAEPVSASPEPESTDAVSTERSGAGGAVSGKGKRGGKAVRGNAGRDSGNVDQPSGRGRSPRRKARSGQQLDYRITDTDDIEAGGERTKYKANVEAIRTLKKIESEGRSATAEEQAILVKYTGWGGLKNAFEGWQKGWEDAPRELQELLTDEEYASARRSTPNAHYTSPTVVRGIWDGIQKLGFKGGRINEPAIGTGIFYGLIPDDIASSSQLFGVELDSLSARISKQLYQSASIENRGFQDVKYPDNFFDLFVSNVPFDEKTHPHDTDMPRDMNFNLHDFYFAKALKKTRPGGLVAFITSKGTMDKGTPAMRRWMAKQADFVGAIRLPKSAFGKIASTEVVTDIIVFQKRESGKEDQSVPFLEVKDLEQDGQTFPVNEYFVEHPDHILGKLSYEGSMYRSNELTVEDTGIDLGAKVSEIMAQFDTPVDINAGLVKIDEQMHQPDYQKLAPENVKERAYVVDGKDIYQNVDGVMQKVKVSATIASRFKKMIPVRDAARRLISLQVNPDSTETEVQKAREDLNRQYDDFAKEYKPFHDSYNQRLFFEDPDLPLLLALENWDNEKKTADKAKIFSERTQFPVKQITTAETPQDAVAISMSEKAKIDVDYIASLLGIEPGDVAKQILGQAYENPETGQWEPTYLYLSGNVRKKLEAAKAAAELDPKYKPNIEALGSSQPQDIPAADISVRLGASWVPEDIYGDFAAHLIGRRTMRFARLSHDGSWVVSGNGTSPQWETKHFTTSDLLAVVMNQRQPKVWEKDADGNRHLDQDATTAAQVAAEKIRDEFTKWVWKDAARTKALSRLYNDTFNNTVHPKWDGSYLQFPGQSHTILHNGKLRPHQYNAVARFLTNGNLLLAHAVGAGKTYAGVSMAMEARRTGLARKPVFVVPNHKVDDWRVDFMKLYPSANILSATKSDFEAKNRQKLMHRIATGDWDAVIVPMSSFEKIQMSPDRVQAFFQDQLDELEMMIREQKASRDQSSKSITKQLEKSKSALEERLKKMSAGWKKDAGPYFDELGIDMLFVDESHAYKNLFFTTKMERISGLQVSQTQRSLDMYLKTQFLNQTTNNRGVVFATGTPITNTIGEMYTLQRYLQPQSLKDAGIEAFDFWANAFGDTVTDVEVDPTGGGFRINTRFAKFTNLPELMQMFRGVADVVTKRQMGIPLPKLKTGKPITIQTEPTADVQDYIKGLIDRAEKVKSRQVRPDEDNMLKITNDGRHVALDARLRIPGAKDDPNSKINRCVAEVKRVYDETAKDKCTQIIWCDLSTPGKGWSIYDELRQKLIAAGIPKDQIAAIHDAKDEKQQATLYDRMNKGKLRIMLASTGKMGTGANVQQRLKAAHHLTAPWVPAEVEQRDGRIERQGNMYEEVEVYQYVTKGTFDAYMWQTLETKAKFIEQAMNGESTAREIEDVSKNSLTFAEVKALASGNPKILEAIKLDAEVKKLQAQERSHLSEQIGIREQAHTYLPSEIASLERDIPNLEKDAAKAKAALDKAGSDIDITFGKNHYTKRADAATALADALGKINKLVDAEGHIGSAYGFDMWARWIRIFGNQTPWWRITLYGTGNTVKYTADLGDSDSGNITRIINTVAGIEDKLNQSKASLSNKKQRLEEMKKLVDAPFEKAGELTEKKEQLRKIQAELQAKPGAAKQQPDTNRTGQDPTITVPSAQGGFVGGRPGAARTTISAITREDMKTGSANADSFLKRTKGYGWTTPSHPLKKFAMYAYRFVRSFRFLPSLPKTMEFAKVREAFRQIMEVPKLAYDTAVEKMKWALQPVEGTSLEARKRMEAVRMKLIADDLAEDAENGVALPPGLEQADVVAMKTRADELYNTYPTVRESYDRIRQVVKETTDMLVDEGWLSKEQAKEMYFPHKVIKYLRNNDGFFGIGRKPSEPFKGYLKQRKGGADYSTDVLERLIEHWAEVRRDIDTVRFLEKVYKQEHADFRAANPNWEEGDAIPEGYREQVILPGRFYYRVGGVTEDLATALLAQDLNAIQEILEAKDEKGVDAVKKVMALGKKRAYIVREEIAKQTLDMPTAPVSDHALYKAIQHFNTFTKRQILFNPLYAIPFHVTNFVGDTYKVSVATPGALKHSGMVDYWKAIKAAHAGQKPTLLAEAQTRGVIGSGWLGVDVKKLEALIPELERAEISGGLKELENKAKLLYNATKTLGQSREDWLRYATFAYLVDLQNQGKDITRFAVKDVRVVKGLEGYDKAAKIARDILGDYSAIGKSGVFISDTVAPFYRWMHLNTPWWPRMIAEYAKRGDVGRLTAAMIAAAAPYMLAMLWNYSDDERRKIEEKLPLWKRWNFHIIVGGKVWSMPLPLDDIVNFLGIPENLADFQSYQKGFIDFRQLVGRIAANMAYQPGLAALNSVGGALGTLRDFFGFKTFPDIADYRVKEWDKRAMNMLKTVFGAPAQIAEAVLRDDDAKVHDLLWRSFMPMRPWTLDRDPVDVLAGITRVEDQTAKPNDPTSWRPHIGKEQDVDRLRAQVDKLTPEELKEAQSRRAQRKAEKAIERVGKDFKDSSETDILDAIAKNTYRYKSRDHNAGDPHKDSEDRVNALKQEYQKRTGRGVTPRDIQEAQNRLRMAELEKRTRK